jgi:hypothetical protein
MGMTKNLFEVRDSNGNLMNLGAILGGPDALLALRVHNAIQFLSAEPMAVSCNLDSGHLVSRAPVQGFFNGPDQE